MPTPKKSASIAATTTQMVLQFRDMKAPTLRTVFDNSILSEGMIRDPSAPRPRGRATDRRAAVKPYCARIMLAERGRVNALAQETTGPVAEDHSIVPNSNPCRQGPEAPVQTAAVTGQPRCPAAPPRAK